MKMLAVTGLFLLVFLTGAAFAQGDRSGEVEMLRNGLKSGSSAQRVKAAKLITQAGIQDEVLYEQVAAILQAGFTERKGSDHDDEMSWLCKALAASGDSIHEALLQEIADTAPSRKVRNYAKQSAGLIEEYAERNRILNSMETWDVDLSSKENRLVNMLRSDKTRLKKDAAKTVVRSIGVHDKVYGVVAEQLLKMQVDGLTDSESIDTMAWLCKALAGSGDSQYVESLNQVRAGTSNPKLKTHASKALKQIE